MTYRDILSPLVPILAALLLMGGLVVFVPDKGGPLNATAINIRRTGQGLVIENCTVYEDPNLIVTDEDGNVWGVIDDPCDPTAIRLVQTSNATEISIDPNTTLDVLLLEWDKKRERPMEEPK